MWCNLCFWYIPDDFKNLKIEDNYDIFAKLCSYITANMKKRGNVLIDNSPMANPRLPNFFRLVCASPKVRDEDMGLSFIFTIKYYNEAKNCHIWIFC